MEHRAPRQVTAVRMCRRWYAVAAGEPAAVGNGPGETRRLDGMDARDLLLEEHSAVHSASVGGNTFSIADRTFAGLTDEQMRVRPREDLNSLAWIMWHIARAEDVMTN